ncbi:unnamed protein product [Macrosiphum euphorbiae]|uniref:Uncharacterized protein n=1 Tax=Macrosiphum euphorbiae TaxID=13131 RepID=A0AAV0X0V3_9HEMI|nr:unnamed protein product [Macrosiphum euphorbiae]
MKLIDTTIDSKPLRVRLVAYFVIFYFHTVHRLCPVILCAVLYMLRLEFPEPCKMRLVPSSDMTSLVPVR